MAKGHVGRPTNEEVAARKRKKMLKIIVPSALILVAIIVLSQGGLSSLMGNTTCDYSCEDGWSLDEDRCYQENVATSEIEAYLVGDVVNDNGELNPDGKVTLQDWTVIKNAIESNEQLDDRQKLVYDLNGDGTVNDDDVSSYSTSTSGQFVFGTKYVCPKQSVDEQTSNDETNDDEIKTTVTNDYVLNGTKCSVKTTTRVSKKAACKLNEELEEQPDDELEEETPGEETLEETPEDSDTTTSDTSAGNCVYDAAKNTYLCGQAKELIKNDTGITDDDVEVGDDENDYNPIDESLEYDDDTAMLNKTSNYLKYADANSSEWALAAVTVDSQTGLFAALDGDINVYQNDKCETRQDNKLQTITNITIRHSGQDVLSTQINKGGNVTKAIIRNKENTNVAAGLDQHNYIKNAVNTKGYVDVFLKLTLNDKKYSIQKNCQKVTIKKGQTTIPIAQFNVKAPAYSTLGIDFGKRKSKIANNGNINYEINGKKYNKIPSGYSYKVSVANGKLRTGFTYNKKTNKLVGFNLMNGSNYLCYKNAKHDNQDFAWAKTCSHGRILFLANKTNELAYYLKNGGNYKLSSVWKYNKITIKLKNQVTKKAYQRSAKLQLYNTVNGCKNKTANDKFGKLYTQPQFRKSNKGVLKISNNLVDGKTYYLRVDISGYYNKASSPQCIAIKSSTKTKNIELVPLKYKVKYTGGKEASGSIKAQTKYADKVIKLQKNKGRLKRKGYTFDYWVASRQVKINGVKTTQYKGFASASAAKKKDYSWTSLVNCKTYGYKKYVGGAQMNINTFEGDITMRARWIATKKVQAKSGSSSPKKNEKILVTVKFAKGDKSATGTMSDQKIVKLPGQKVKIKGNAFKRKKYKFNFWVATRQHNGKKQYWCYKSASNHNSKVWVNATKYSKVKNRVVKYSNKADFGLDSSVVTLHAHWKKN